MFNAAERSLMKMVKSNGPSLLPCDTRDVIGKESEKHLPILTLHPVL